MNRNAFDAGLLTFYTEADMAKQNCWEFKNCGRHLGGNKAAESGICIAATETRVNGVHGGKNGGRTCWAVAGTLCGGKVRGSYAIKLATCLSCEFYKMVTGEEGTSRVNSNELLAKVQ